MAYMSKQDLYKARGKGAGRRHRPGATPSAGQHSVEAYPSGMPVAPSLCPRAQCPSPPPPPPAVRCPLGQALLPTAARSQSRPAGSPWPRVQATGALAAARLAVTVASPPLWLQCPGPGLQGLAPQLGSEQQPDGTCVEQRQPATHHRHASATALSVPLTCHERMRERQAVAVKSRAEIASAPAELKTGS